MPESLTVEQVDGTRPGHTVLRLRGPITVQNLFPFQTAERESRGSSLILEMTGVPYIDSVGVGALVGAYVSRNKEGRRVALVGLGQRVNASLAISNLTQFFPTFPTIEAAEQSLG